MPSDTVYSFTVQHYSPASESSVYAGKPYDVSLACGSPNESGKQYNSLARGRPIAFWFSLPLAFDSIPRFVAFSFRVPVFYGLPLSVLARYE